MNKHLERIKKTPETTEEELAGLGQLLEGKLMHTVEPEGKLDDNGRFEEMTYSGRLVKANEDGEGYNWHTVSVTIPDDSEQPRRYSVAGDLPNQSAIEWRAGDSAATFTETDGRGSGATVQEATHSELNTLMKTIGDSRVFDPTKEEVVHKYVERGWMTRIVETIEPKKRTRRFLGRRALGRGSIR